MGVGKKHQPQEDGGARLLVTYLFEAINSPSAVEKREVSGRHDVRP